MNSTSNKDDVESSPILRALNKMPTFNTKQTTLAMGSLNDSEESLEVDFFDEEDSDSSNQDALPSDRKQGKVNK